MEHALIIGGTRRSVDALEEELWDAGYYSILATRSMAEAWGIVRCFHPNLVVIVPDKSSHMPAEELGRMSEVTGAPIIVATAEPEEALRCLGPKVSLDGPYPANEVAQAGLNAARQAAPRLATAA